MTTRKWEIPAPSGSSIVTVEQSENGKEVIRVDGRIAARPLDPAETERQFVSHKATYTLRRTDNEDFELDLMTGGQENELAVATVTEPVRLSVGGLQALSETFRTTRILWAAVAVVIVVLFLWASGPGYEKQARERVEFLLAEMSLGSGPQEQVAIGIWARNKRNLSLDELEWAVRDFPDFRTRHDLRRKFTDWKVLDSEEVEGAKVPTAIVSIEVEGRQLKMLVPERMPISWAD